jgi:uncharacterized protein (DUF952 family)
MIFHITTDAEWDQHLGKDHYFPNRFNKDGFIHCSTGRQVKRIADALFRDYQEIILLHIDDSAEKKFLKFENLEGGTELFPHIYRKLPKQSIVTTSRVRKTAGYGFDIPGELTAPVQ